VLDTTDYYEVKHSNQVQDVLKPFLQYKTILKETVLGKDHPDTLTTMNNLAISLDRQGKYTEAEAMHRQTLQLRETLLGKGHPDTLRSMNDLAISLDSRASTQRPRLYIKGRM
jgi:hypothetical protein